MFRFSTSFGTHLLVYSFVQKIMFSSPLIFPQRKTPSIKRVSPTGYFSMLLHDL